MFLTKLDAIPSVILYIYMFIGVITIAILIYLIIKRLGEVDDFEQRDN
jgi:hypothetical protein